VRCPFSGWERPEYQVGRRFLELNITAHRRLFFACRLVAGLFSCLAAACIYVVAHRLYGTRSAVAAVVIWCFSPMVLGHGATIVHDVPGAAMLVLAFLAFLNFLDGVGLPSALCFGVFAGLAVLTRVSAIPVIAFWLLSFLAVRFSGVTAHFWRRAGHVAVSAAVVLLVLNAGYGFSRCMTCLGDYQFFSRTFAGDLGDSPAGNRCQGTALAAIPVPLPKDFVHGLDLQQRDFESPSFPSYLCGEWRDRDWWYYYIFGWCLKTPIGFQALLLLSLLSLIKDLYSGRANRVEWLMLGSSVLVFVIASWKSGFTTHYRYVIPAFPFMTIASTRLWRDGASSIASRFGAAALLIYGVISSLAAFPHSLSYFNEFAGGPTNGGRYLLHSSCDWGQDLYLLAEWYRTHEGNGKKLFLECHGALTTEQLGLPRNSIPGRRHPSSMRSCDELEIEAGLYVVSVSSLYDKSGLIRYLDRLKPCEHIGYSLKVYDLSCDDIKSLRLNEPVGDK
jgi:hypothetical protein